MRLFLLGCTGFVGSKLVPRLINAGHEVTVISRKISQEFQASVNNKKCIHIQLNPASNENWQSEELLKALRQADAVINLAGEPIAEKRWTKEHCKLIEDSRLQTTRNLIGSMNKLKTPPKTLINGSAIGFYGTSENKIFNEQSSAGEDFLAKLCDRWEGLAAQKPESTRLVILRIGIVLEKQGGALKKMLPIFKSGFGGPLGNGKQWMSWIHLSDLCQIIENALIENKFSGPINCVAPNPVSMKQFAETLARSLKKPSLLAIPSIILKLLIGDGAKIVLEGQKVIPKKLQSLEFKFQYSAIDQTLKSIISS